MLAMPLQRTIELIPTSLVKSKGYKPPMTSKQVKKEYLKAHQLKGVSRAEQRRLDQEELARQKKEYEREKVAARARALKEAKAAKSLAETGLRKKAGQPRSIRPISASQTSISKFARNCLSGKRNRAGVQVIIEDSDSRGTTLCDSEEEKEKDVKSQDEPQDRFEERPTKRLAASVDSDDEFGDFPFCSQLDIMSTPVEYQKLKKPSLPQFSVNQILRDQDRPLNIKSEVEFNTKNSSNLAYLEEDPQKFIDPQLDSKSPEVSSELDFQFSQNQSMYPIYSRATRSKPKNFTDNAKLAISPIARTPLERKSVQLRHNKCVKLKNVEEPAIISDVEGDLPPPPPLATQIFLETHLEDFLPSSSQEMRELLEDIDVDDLSSNTQIMSEIGLDNSTRSNQSCIFHSETDSTKSTEDANHLMKFENKDGAYTSITTGSETDQSSMKQLDNFDDFICTQDLEKLSQEIRSTKSPEVEVEKQQEQQSKQRSKERKLFFEEKEDDLLKAALDESRIMSNKTVIKIQRLAPVGNLKTSCSSAIVGSKPLIESSSAKSSTNLPKERQELPVTPNKDSPPLLSQTESSRDSDEVEKSSSFISHSFHPSPTTTDYGIDELGGDDWDELSALC